MLLQVWRQEQQPVWLLALLLAQLQAPLLEAVAVVEAGRSVEATLLGVVEVEEVAEWPLTKPALPQPCRQRWQRPVGMTAICRSWTTLRPSSAE